MKELKLHRKYIFRILFFCACFASSSASGKSATVFIHGTLFPFISYYYHGVSAPAGITLASSQPLSNTLGKMSYVLSKAAPLEFPSDTFFLLGWPGKLHATVRRKAAQQLYDWIRISGFTEFTIIGHSHGATIALLLAELVEAEKNNSFSVDRLILIACPVQKVTSHLVNSSLFKKIYNLYSSGDIAQICDVQGYNYCLPVLSERTFVPRTNLKQAKILINGKVPAHNDFLLNENFLNQLPTVLFHLDKKDTPCHVEMNCIQDKPLSFKPIASR